MTEFEKELLSVLRDIRDELQVATMPEHLRRLQRVTINTHRHITASEDAQQHRENALQSHIDELNKLHPGKEFDELLDIDEELQSLHRVWDRGDKHMSKLIKQLEDLQKKGCVTTLSSLFAE
jgi:hypothetical protein